MHEKALLRIDLREIKKKILREGIFFKKIESFILKAWVYLSSSGANAEPDDPNKTRKSFGFFGKNRLKMKGKTSNRPKKFGRAEFLNVRKRFGRGNPDGNQALN